MCCNGSARFARGWNTSFDRLDRILGASAMTERFLVEREFAVPPAELFAAWTDV